MTKLVVTKQIDSLTPYDFDGTIESTIDRLNEYKKYTNPKIDVDCDYRDNTYSFNIWVDQLETDEEYEYRLEQERKEEEKRQNKLKILAQQRELAKQLDEAMEKAMYFKLKAKYEKG